MKSKGVGNQPELLTLVGRKHVVQLKDTGQVGQIHTLDRHRRIIKADKTFARTGPQRQAFSVVPRLVSQYVKIGIFPVHQNGSRDRR